MIAKTIRRFVTTSLITSSLAIGGIMVAGLYITPQWDASAQDSDENVASTFVLDDDLLVDAWRPCDMDSCLFNNDCISKPENATCLIGDKDNARVCDPWFVERWSDCIANEEYEQERLLAQQKKASQQVPTQHAAATVTPPPSSPTPTPTPTQSAQQANRQADLAAKQQSAAEAKRQADLLAQQQAATDAAAAKKQAAADAKRQADLLAAKQQAAADAAAAKRRTKAS